VVKVFLDLRGFSVGAFGGLHQRGEAGGVICGNVSQDLAVQLDAGLLEAADELVVADPLGSGGGADAYDPDRTILALLLLAPAIGELQPALNRLFGGAMEF